MKVIAAAGVVLIGLAGTAAEAASEAVNWTGSEAPGTIIVKNSERKLVLVTGPGAGLEWPVAIGRPGAQFHGETQVVAKIKDPGWVPTPHMQAHEHGLPAYVPPGPKNPLGTRALYLAGTYVHIHGTNKPSSIGQAVSHGCIRMQNADVEELFEKVTVGAKVVVVN